MENNNYLRVDEETKRLAPTAKVLRELYLKSGNQCAFPGCVKPLVDNQGNFIGEVCHIEAASPGGERFNPNMTNEERRAYNNLMLMCHEHHVVTDNVQTFPVEVLKQMKRKHEEKYSDMIQRMKESIIDYGFTDSFKMCASCKRMSEVLGFNLTDTESYETASILNGIIPRLCDLPFETRKLLSIMVKRSYTYQHLKCIVPIHEVESATKLKPEYICRQVDILMRRDIVDEIEMYDGLPTCELRGDHSTGWCYWNDIREFCEKSGTSVETICVDLDFSVFDTV